MVPSESHTLLLRQHFLKVFSLWHWVFKYQSPFQTLLLGLIDILHWEPTWWNISVFSFHVVLLFSSFSSPPTLLYKLTWFYVTQGPLFSLLLKVNFHLYLAKLLHFSTLLSSFPFCCVFVETSSADSHRKRGKSPLLIPIHTSSTVSHSLLSPVLLMFPPLISTQSWGTLPWPHTIGEWELGLTGREVQASAKRESQRHSFVIRTVRKAICMDICL